MCFKKLLFVISLTSLLIMVCSCKSAIKDDANSSTNVASEEESSLDIENERKSVDIKIDSVDISDIEGDKTYQIIRYSVLTCSDDNTLQDLLDDLNASMKNDAESFANQNKSEIREFLKEHPDMPEAEYTHTSDISVQRNDGKYLSLTEFVYENMMGAHGMYVELGHVYDVQNGKKLELTDLINDKQELATFLKKWVSDHNDEYGTFDYANDTIDAYVKEEYDLEFYLTSELIVVFQPYDIAPYAAGLIEIKVDDDLLKVRIDDI